MSELPYPQQSGGDGPQGRQLVPRTKSQYLLCWISQALTSALRMPAVIPSRWGPAWGRLLWGQVSMDKGSAKRAGQKVRP